MCKDLKGGTDGSMAAIAVIRRLTFEAQTLITADAKFRIERTDEDKPKKMAHIERETRLQSVERNLLGLTLNDELEGSNGLIDLCRHS